MQPKMYRALFLACDEALVARRMLRMLVWEVPLQSLDKTSKAELCSSGVLEHEDRRRFAFKAVYDASRSL